MFLRCWEVVRVMYCKLIFRNVKRSARDYLIYIVTMTVCAMLFYAFLSISSRYYHPDIGAEFDLTILGDGMKIAICSVTLLILFLIRYVNNYMLLHRQREFAMQSVLGMEQRTIAWLFFAETFVLGAVCVFSGILAGMICSQFITAMLLSAYGLEYRLSWMLFPDTALLTICFFAISLMSVGLFNVRTIRKVRIIDMLCAGRQNEPQPGRSRYMRTVTILHSIVLSGMILSGISTKYFYFDSRFALPVHIMFHGIIAAPLIAFVWPLIWLARRKDWGFDKLVILEMLFTFVSLCFSASVPRICSRYYLSFGSSALGSDTGSNKYLLFLLADLIYLICGIIYLSGEAICLWKRKSPAYTYSGQNLFFFGQLVSRLTTTARTMTLICLTLVFSVFLFLAAPALTGWASGYLDLRALYDVQISTSYTGVYQESDLPSGDYGLVDAFLEERDIGTAYDCTFNLCLPRREEFKNRVKLDFPVVAISLSDYNTLREMLGYEPVSLKENEFVMQWQTIATREEQEEFMREHTVLETDAGTLTVAQEEGSPSHSGSTSAAGKSYLQLTVNDNRDIWILYYEDALGETLYNRYTDVIYVLPDSVCRKLLPVMRNRYIQTTEAIPYTDALQLEARFLEEYPEVPVDGEGPNYYLRTRTCQVNETKASIFITHASMTYSGIVLMVICLTVLSLQQLLDASKYRYRFGILKKLGVDENEIRKLILKQLGVWFGLPVSVAVLAAAVLAAYFFNTITAQISAYIGHGVLLTQVAVTAGILALLLICYFISTWILFKKSVGD